MMKAGKGITFAAVTLAVVLLLVGALLLANLGIWYRAQHGLEDWAQSGAAAEPDPRVVIVAIDDASLTRQRQPWPWPRKLLARLVDRIGSGRPRVVGIDVLFTNRIASDAAGDKALAASVAKIDRMVLLDKLVFSASGKDSQVLLPIEELREHATGYFNISLDSDHVFRRQRLQQEIQGRVRVAFAYQLFLQWQGPGKRVAPLADAVMRVPFRGPPETFLMVSADDVLSGKVPAATFKGRAVLVGATFTDAKDVYPTPVSPDAHGYMHGVEIHANIISALLDGRELRALSPRLGYLACLAMLVVVAVITVRRPRIGGGVGALMVVVAAGLFWALFQIGLIIPVVPLSVTVLLGWTMGFVVRNRIRRDERRRMQGVLKLIVPPSVDEAILSGASLSTSEQPVTLCIIDIDKFAEVAESLIRRGHGRHLHAYVAGVSAIVERHGGMLVEDFSVGIMAVFGIDARQVDHTVRSCRAALDLMTTVGQMEQEWRHEVGVSLNARIGVHTGPVSISAPSSGGRELTVVGRELLLATRLARLSKQYGCTILISDEVARVLSDQFRLQELGEIRLRGRKSQSRVFSVLGEVALDQTMVQDS